MTRNSIGTTYPKFILAGSYQFSCVIHNVRYSIVDICVYTTRLALCFPFVTLPKRVKW